jgi:hypothetical protein
VDKENKNYKEWWVLFLEHPQLGHKYQHAELSSKKAEVNIWTQDVFFTKILIVKF